MGLLILYSSTNLLNKVAKEVVSREKYYFLFLSLVSVLLVDIDCIIDKLGKTGFSGVIILKLSLVTMFLVEGAALVLLLPQVTMSFIFKKEICRNFSLHLLSTIFNFLKVVSSKLLQ